MTPNDVIQMMTEAARRDVHPRVLALAEALTADDVQGYVAGRKGLTVDAVLSCELSRIHAARWVYARRYPITDSPEITQGGMTGGLLMIANALGRANQIRAARVAIMMARQNFALKNRRGILISLDRAASCRRAAIAAR